MRLARADERGVLLPGAKPDSSGQRIVPRHHPVGPTQQRNPGGIAQGVLGHVGRQATMREVGLKDFEHPVELEVVLVFVIATFCSLIGEDSRAP